MTVCGVFSSIARPLCTVFPAARGEVARDAVNVEVGRGIDERRRPWPLFGVPPPIAAILRGVDPTIDSRYGARG